MPAPMTVMQRSGPDLSFRHPACQQIVTLTSRGDPSCSPPHVASSLGRRFCAVAIRVKESPAMNTNSRYQRWGGAAFVLGNLLFIVNKLDEMSRLFLGRWMPDVISGQDLLLILSGQVALIVGYVAFYQCYAPRVGRFGRRCAAPILWRRDSAGRWACRLHCLLCETLCHLSCVRSLNHLFLLVLVGLLCLLMA